MLPRPTRAHYLGYIMRVVGYGRGYAGGMFGRTPPRTLPLSPFAEKATSGHSNTAAGPMCGWIPESVPPSSSQTIKGCGHSHMTPTAPGLSSEWALWLWLASISGPVAALMCAVDPLSETNLSSVCHDPRELPCTWPAFLAEVSKNEFRPHPCQFSGTEAHVYIA